MTTCDGVVAKGSSLRPTAIDASGEVTVTVEPLCSIPPLEARTKYLIRQLMGNGPLLPLC